MESYILNVGVMARFPGYSKHTVAHRVVHLISVARVNSSLRVNQGCLVLTDPPRKSVCSGSLNPVAA